MTTLLEMAQLATECVQAGRTDEALLHLGMLEAKLAASQAQEVSQIPNGFVIIHPEGLLESAEKAFHGSRDTLAHLIRSNTWAPAPLTAKNPR